MDFEEKIRFFIKYDEPTRIAFDKVEICGSDAVFELKKAFEAFGDSSRLPAIADLIVKEYEHNLINSKINNSENTLMERYQITRDGEQFLYKTYRYDKLEFAIEYAIKQTENKPNGSDRTTEYDNGVAELQFGVLNSSMVCPHCQTKGKVRTKHVDKISGISGGKATAAVLTGGVSLIATGLSRKDAVTQAHCEECKNTWTF